MACPRAPGLFMTREGRRKTELSAFRMFRWLTSEGAHGRVHAHV